MDKYSFELSRQRWETVHVAVTQVFKWVPISVIAYFGYKSISALAGHTTITQFGMFLVADLKANTVVSHIVTSLFGIGGITYGVKERRLRHKTIERMSSQATHLEEKFDADRTSSRLTKKGTTRPEDRV